MKCKLINGYISQLRMNLTLIKNIKVIIQIDSFNSYIQSKVIIKLFI